MLRKYKKYIAPAAKTFDPSSFRAKRFRAIYCFEIPCSCETYGKPRLQDEIRRDPLDRAFFDVVALYSPENLHEIVSLQIKHADGAGLLRFHISVG